jgi:Tfp pilus assembly protein PilN
MINLLPPETKKQIRAARMNVILVNYCVLIIFTAVVLATVFVLGFWANASDEQLANDAKATSNSSAAAYSDTRKQADSFAKDLATAKTILASDVSFSQLILDISSVVPSGVILNNLSLGTSSQNTPIDISGRAVSADAAIALKNSLDASPIFENVNIVNVSQTDLSTVADVDPLFLRYPFTVNLKAQFTKKPSSTAKTETKT